MTGVSQGGLTHRSAFNSSFPFPDPYARIPRHRWKDRQIPSAYIPSFANKQHDLQHDEHPARYPLEIFDCCPLGHRDIGSVIESGDPEEVLT